jgi:hypothetical protein
MYDLLAKRLVMIGNDAKQDLDHDQVYLTADDEAPLVERIQIQIGPHLTDASEGVTVTVADLAQALRQFGLRVTRS